MNKNDCRGLVETPGLDILGPLQDIIRQVREEKLTKEQLQAFAEHRNPFSKKGEVVTLPFKYDKAQDGWKLIEDVPFDLSGQDGKPFTPDIIEFLKKGESSVNGEVMKQRAKELNAHLGQHHAEYLLEHQDLIPKEWRGKYYLVFPGTVWQDPDGDRHVSYLYWDDDQWDLHFYWLGDVWDGDDRLVACK